ncbi:hypothetical protein DL98DRAFT_624518 [Cadophora sp. DSE1049]|nr:hypothetical protein DL98DRAFT_624518 [Cadophora sp. DSE1049]
MQEQFGDSRTPLGSVIAFIGSAGNAQAVTVKDYLAQTWPNTFSALLSLLEKSLQNGTYGHVEVDPCFKLKFTPGSGSSDYDEITIDGTHQKIVEVVQQLMFLGSAMTTSKTGRIARSQGRIIPPLDVRKNHIDMIFRVDDIPRDETCCWHELVLNSVIAYNFPIPDRGPEVGLEIPIRMMAALGGAAHQVEYEGGILIKGFSAMFIPLKRTGNSIQWHFIYNKDDSRLPYREADKRCPGRAFIDTVDHSSLNSTRAFLGWWSNTTSCLGTADANYENISWTELKEPERSATFSGGSIGFQMFGMGELNFAVGPKDSKLHISRPGPYQRIIKHASKTPIVLFDPIESDRRAWLVPGSAVIAHIAQARHAREPFQVDDQPVSLTPTIPALDVYAAAEAILRENAGTVLDHDPCSNSLFYFRDLVLGIWSLLEVLMDRDVKAEASADPKLHGTLRKRIRGYEFMDLVEERSPVRMKETLVENSSGNWIEFVQDINAVVLFASGFEDIIIPREVEQHGLCHSWKRVPRGKDYLTASVSMLDTCFEQAGSQLTRKYLTSTHLRWHRGPKLFESCTKSSAFGCRCDRVQQILPEAMTTFGTITSPGPLPKDGAVVFGKSKNVLKQLIL